MCPRGTGLILESPQGQRTIALVLMTKFLFLALSRKSLALVLAWSKVLSKNALLLPQNKHSFGDSPCGHLPRGHLAVSLWRYDKHLRVLFVPPQTHTMAAGQLATSTLVPSQFCARNVHAWCWSFVWANIRWQICSVNAVW